MTAPGPVRPMLKCKICGHSWRPLRATVVPKCCSYCGSPYWQLGAEARINHKANPTPQAPVEAPEAPPSASDPHQPLRDLVESEYAAYLTRRALQDERSREEYRERRGQRRYEPYEVAEANVRPPMLQTGVTFTLPRMPTRRSRRKKGSG